MAKRKTNSKTAPKTLNSKKNHFMISWAPIYYNGKEIKTLTPIHTAQEIHKYNLGLFVSGIVGLVFAFVNMILISLNISNGNNAGLSSAITVMSCMFMVVLLIDIIFTINLNRYIKDKRWLFLYIPGFVLMVVFAIPEIINMFADIFSIPDFVWGKYVIIVICILYIIAEIIRMVLARNELDLKQELKRVLA